MLMLSDQDLLHLSVIQTSSVTTKDNWLKEAQ